MKKQFIKDLAQDKFVKILLEFLCEDEVKLVYDGKRLLEEVRMLRL